MMHKRHQHEEVTLERLERARAAIAYAMTLDGAVYGTFFERLDREFASRRATDDVMARAQRCLNDYAAATLPAAGVRPIS